MPEPRRRANAKEALITPGRTARISSNEEIAPGVYLLRFARRFSFVAGQVVAVARVADGPARYYSIASGEAEDTIELLYDLVPGGALTPLLSDLTAGDEILVSDPFGSFIDNEQRAWWIATGTGVAPFVSMVRSGKGEGRRLLHGGRTLDRLYFRTYLTGVLGTNYVCCCSTEEAEGVYPGRLTSWIREQAELPGDTRYMLCGGAAMVVDVRDILIKRGVPFDGIAAEIYF